MVAINEYILQELHDVVVDCLNNIYYFEGKDSFNNCSKSACIDTDKFDCLIHVVKYFMSNGISD